jgi:hypothetical protein
MLVCFGGWGVGRSIRVFIFVINLEYDLPSSLMHLLALFAVRELCVT